MKKTRKVLSLILALNMSVPMMGAVIPVSASTSMPDLSQAAEDFKSSTKTNQDFMFIDTGDDTVAIALYKGNGGEVVVPEEVDGKKVVSIWGSAFKDCESLKSIEIPDSVEYIGESTFSGCKNLTTVKLPNSITSLANNVFEYCESLTDLQIPYGVEAIGEFAFGKCINLSNINIPNSVTSIAQYAFDDCNSLKSIEIPSSVTDIGVCVFRYCYGLESINVDSENRNYKSIDGILYNKDVTELVACPCGKTSAKIPESVTTIGWAAFIECKNLTNIEIPDGVTNIGEHAFDGCQSLTSVVIPAGVTTVEAFAFCGCPSLKSIEIPNSVSEIRIYGISYCQKLRDVYYTGTKDEWNKIEIDEFSEVDLEDATIHYNSKMPEKPSTPDTPDTPDAKRGDINNDGKITAKDSMMIQRYAVNLISLDDNQIKAADINKDGKVTNKDALAILRFTIGYKVEGLS